MARNSCWDRGVKKDNIDWQRAHIDGSMLNVAPLAFVSVSKQIRSSCLSTSFVGKGISFLCVC